MKKILLFTLFIFLLFSCSINRIGDNNLFDTKITRWHNFTLKGIITVNYKQFQFIKNIKISKNQSSLSLNIFDGGIWGISNQMLLSVRIDSLLHIKSSEILKIPTFDINLEKIDNFIQELQRNKNLIIKTKVFSHNSLKIYFSQNYDFRKIIYKDFILLFEDQYRWIKLYKKNKLLFKIEIDNLNFGEN